MIQGFKEWRGGNSLGDYVGLGMPLDHDDIVNVLRDNLDVTHVVIPHTNIGYGAGVLDYSNQDALDRDYGGRVHKVKHDYAFTRLQVIRFPELWDIISGLAYDYPSLDDELYSIRETELLEEHVLECITDYLYVNDIEYLRDNVIDWLHDRSDLWNDGETCHLDNDGRTPYMSEDSLASLVSAYIEQH